MNKYSAAFVALASLLFAASSLHAEQTFRDMFLGQPPLPPQACAGLVTQSPVLATLRKSAEAGGEEAKDFLSAVSTGHPDGPTDLGLLESDQGFFALTISAGFGHTAALYEYGMRSLLGIGFGRDPAKAAYWFGRAAREGNALAIFTMGRLAEEGLGMPRDTEEALRSYRRAADLGNYPAQIFLHVIYRDGLLGVAPDAKQAELWRQRIVHRRQALADLLPQSNQAILEQDRAKVAAEAGDVDAQYVLGRMYEDPKGLNDRGQSRDWYLLAAAQGSAEAMFALGRLSAHEEERYWWLQAARLGHGAACQNIAWSYLEGRGGLPKDEQQGLSWLLEASAMGDDNAAFHLGEFYESGKFVKQDAELARRWYQQAVRLGSPEAEEALDRLNRPRDRFALAMVLPDGSLSPEAQEGLQWISTLGLPAVRDLPTANVWTGGTEERQGNIKPIFIPGFLVEEAPDRIVILNSALAREEYKYPPKSAVKNRREETSFDEFAASFLAARTPFPGWYGFSQNPTPSRFLGNFLLAWISQQKQRDDLAAKFLARALEDPRSLYSPSLKDLLRTDAAEYFFQLAILDFADAALSREQIAERLRAFAIKFPGTREASQAQVLADGVDSLVAEEAARPAELPNDAPPEQRARALVWQLRDPQAGNPISVVKDLTTLGDAAVPALLAALDDHRPTRHAYCSTRSAQTRVYLETIGDRAEQILRSASRGYPIHSRSDRLGTPSPAQPSPQRREFEAWWAAYQSKGEKQCLLDGIAAGGPDARPFYSMVTERYPAAASEAGAAMAKGYRASSDEMRAAMIQWLPALRHPDWIAALEEEVRHGRLLTLKVRAAERLRALGKNVDQAMLAEWLALLGDWEKHSARAYDNGGFELLAYLFASDDPAIVERTTRDFSSFSRGQLGRMFEGLGFVFRYSLGDRQQPPPPAVQARVEKVYASFLQVDRESWTDPKSCRSVADWVAERLAELLPGKYAYDEVATFTKRAAARARMLNKWRSSVNLPPLPEAKSPILTAENRNTITEVSFGDDHLAGTPLHEEIEKLRGQKLAPEALVQLICDFTAQMPKGVSGLRIRAVRSPGGAVSIKVWSELGSTDPAKRYAWSTMAVHQSGKPLHARTGVPPLAEAAHPEAWQEFTRALTKGLGGAPDAEITARIGLEYSDRD